MSEMQINTVLAQMRAMAAAAGVEQPAESTGNAAGVDFGQLMKQSLDEVNDAQGKAKELATAFETAQEGVELPEVMIAMQKASISFQAITQVRNKLLSAYQEVMNMQV
ncbi:MAG: flagellar hook-basal body complex protein FliE [Halioglobus sp.]|nr:flagellar hook-basal body complex protein FliE [Halioglobus sp.]